MTGAAHYLL